MSRIAKETWQSSPFGVNAFMDAHIAVWDALQATLPPPVDASTARAAGVAATLAAGQNPQQFGEWFDANSAFVLRMLNDTVNA